MPSLPALLALGATLPAALLLFQRLPPGRAFLAMILGTWMFLPQDVLIVQGLPDVGRENAGALASALAATLLHWGWWRRLRWCLWDVPVALYMVLPFVTTVAAGYRPYDGASAVIASTLNIGLPYFLGRCLLRDRGALRDLVVGLFVAGLVYMPLCLLEIRLAPFLHALVYGHADHLAWGNLRRYGGFKPVVFMKGGVMLALFLCLTTVAGVSLTRVRRTVAGIPTWWLVTALLVTTVACKSVGAIVLTFVGLLMVHLTRSLRTRLPYVLLILLVPLTLAVRVSGKVDLESLAGRLTPVFGVERVDSLQYRITNEKDLLADTMRRFPLHGGGTHAPHLYDPSGRQLTTIDSRWIIVLRYRGLIGLALFLWMALTPALLMVRRLRRGTLASAAAQPVIGVTTVSLLFLLDCMVNATMGPLMPMVWGCVAVAGERDSRRYEDLGRVEPAPATATPRDPPPARWRHRPERALS